MKQIQLIALAFCLIILATVQIPRKSIPHKLAPESSDARLARKMKRFDEPLKFFQFHQGIRTPEGETISGYPVGYKTKELQKANQRRRNNPIYARTESPNGVLEFVERGPANVPGRTRAILVLPGDATNSTWLAGSATGGIWKTTNGGQSWVEKSSDFPIYPISSLAMSVSDPNTVYAGTGEFVSSIYSALGDGIFKSTDRGETWTQLPSTASTPDFSIVTRIIVSPLNKDIILASTAPSSLATTSQKSKIFRSTNGGISWTKVYENGNAIQQIIATPGNFNIQYAGIEGIGVAKSIDGGETWALSNANMSPTGRVEIDISPVDPTRVFASCEGGISKTGSDLYVSNDSGATWTIVDVRFNNNPLDFLGGQGFYDNHAICDPFNKDIVYVGGVDTFRSTITAGTSISDDYTINENNTQSFLTLIPFNDANFFQGGRLQVGPNNAKRKVEIRFGPGVNQLAHRFLTPVGATSGVAVNNYAYTDYVSVPLQAWDVTNATAPKQLMVSFRDQSRNGLLDFLTQNFDANAPLLNSREYVYIHSADYNATVPLFAANSTGGQETQFMYAFFPSLPANATWNPTSLPNSNITIFYSGITKQNATTITVTDVRNQFDNKNTQSQVVLDGGGVHADHHCSTVIVTSIPNRTYRLLIGTDGGVFLSKNSTSPGILNGDFTFTGNGFNTSQFYGADKKPGSDEYIGGMQDNGTRISRAGESASKTSSYRFAIGGDGFEVLWHTLDSKKIIGSLYNNTFFRTIDGGTSWSPAFSGFPLVSGSPDATKYPFVSKLAHSKNVPDMLFAVGSDGVWKSTNFGGLWTLTPITNNWGTASTFFDVEVSRANANVVWAGAGMTNLRNIHVSTNGGSSFTSTANYSATTLGFITKLSSHPTQPNTAYALFSFYGKPKILRTTDLGATWTDISGFNTNTISSNGYPDVATYCLYVMPDDPNIIWAGTEIGIVESKDNGSTWSLLDDFPNVSVWDMKGQDDQIVIATHGRGIWTAQMTNNQTPVQRPQLLAMGTRPNQDLAIKFLSPENFDSLQVFLRSQKIGKISSVNVGTYIVNIRGVTPGNNIEAYFIGFKNGAPVQSASIFTNHNALFTPYVRQYANVFTGIGDFVFSNSGAFTLSEFGTSNASLQTLHSYPPNSDIFALLLQPLIVSATNSNFFYQDVALVQTSPTGVQFGQPGFKDFVVVEATKNGLDWIPLKDGYNASANPAWLTALNANQAGTPTLQVDQNIDLKTKFSANDTLLFRFRLKSDNDNVTGWGWSIDNLFIQQQPTGVEPASTIEAFSIFPNPTDGKSTVRYNLRQQSAVVIEVMDATGKIAIQESIGAQDVGTHEHQINLDGKSEGVFVVRVKAGNEIKTSKMVLKK
ncbi:MAG: T9SS type A sorting domain-containing protein [Bacteroidota bacterium]|jgi:hypothetical protein|nr:T9SS type A sorting domain-containing protein [Cytophagales bacterium]